MKLIHKEQQIEQLLIISSKKVFSSLCQFSEMPVNLRDAFVLFYRCTTHLGFVLCMYLHRYEIRLRTLCSFWGKGYSVVPVLSRGQ